MELYLPPIIKSKEKVFRKGNIPWNKGLKGVYFGGKETQFKKGNVPHHTQYDGAISLRKDSGRVYKFIRIAKGKWIPLHRYIYEKAHGPIPAGMIVIFKDGNTLNYILDNLKAITRAENAIRNTNREKAAKSISETWRRTRARYKAGFSPVTKWGERAESGELVIRK